MKQKLLFLLASLMISVASFAGAEQLYVLNEGFEEGTIPSTWTTECVSGQQSWGVEPGATATYPQGAYAGDYRAVLRNPSTQTLRFVTRLITPQMDLSQVFQPILVFAHAQAQRTGDVDTLRVYYRTSEQTRWIKLAEYSDKITSWKVDTIALPAKNETYQIAFEGTDNFGRGIVLDDVIVRPMPTCDQVSNINIDGLTVNSAHLSWIGSFDTRYFRVVLSKSRLTSFTEDVALDTTTVDYGIQLNNLEKNTLYYTYIKAMCQSEEADWVETSFRTKNLVDVPYVQDFNMEYASGTVNHVPYWSYGTNILKEDGSMEYMPFVNQNTSESGRSNFSYSSTTCLVFSGARSTSTAIPAGAYVYAATPELKVDAIQSLQVSFWGTAYDKFGTDYAAGIIVGVMTDPEDFSTFVPVDTFYISNTKTFNRFTSFLDAYQGEGKYIAFASNFLDKENLFFIDDVEIKTIDRVKQVTDLSILNYGGWRFDINANTNGSDQCRLIVTKDTTDIRTGQLFLDPDKLPSSCILLDTIVAANQLPYTVQLDRGGYVQVYAQAVQGNDSSDMCLPVKVLVPVKWNNEPVTYDFEPVAGQPTWMIKNMNNFSSALTGNYEYPAYMLYMPHMKESSSSWSVDYITLYGAGTFSSYNYGHNAKVCIGLKTEVVEFSDGHVWRAPMNGQYIALPEVEDINKLIMKFYLKGYSTDNPTCSRVRVGVVSNPYDITTFEEIAVCNGSGEYKPFIISFANYAGTGKYPVILSTSSDVRYSAGSGSGGGVSYQAYYESNNLIDDISFTLIGGCVEPANMKVEPSYDKANIAWSANNMTTWDVEVFKDKACTERIDSARVDTAAYIVDSLQPNTTYYYKVTTICADTILTSDAYDFTTICPPAQAIPYVEDFERYKGGSTTKDLPFCWNMIQQKYTYSGGSESSTSWYPYIYTSSAHKGSKCLYFYYSSSTSGVTPSMAGKPQVITLPQMAEKLDTLQLTFWMKAGGPALVNDTVFVGVMSDPEDISTFDTLQLIKTTAAYSEYIIRLNNYKGQGKYIAFAKTARELARSVYIDDVVVDYIADCEKTQGVAAKDMNEKGATISWKKEEATQWEVLLTDKSLNLDTTNVDTIAAHTLKDTVVIANSVALDCCPTPNVFYYVYVRALCSETNNGAWSNEISFKTTCVAQTAGELGVIDFAGKANDMACWTVGVREGTTNAPNANSGYLYIFNSAASEGAYAASPVIDIDSINHLQISFDAHGGTGAAYLRKCVVGIITNPADLSTFTEVATIDLPRVSATTAATNNGFNESKRYTIRFNKYTGDYNGDYGKQFMFLSENGGVANYIYIDNIKIDTIQSCMEPIEVEAKEVNTYDASISWEKLGEKYQLQVADSKGALVADTLVSDTIVNIAGLDMLTTYSAQVRTICAEGDTSMWSNPISFTTQCPVAFELPYSENFDSYASGGANFPSCWSRFSSYTSTLLTYQPYVNSSAKKDGRNGMQMYGSTSYYSYAVLPPMAYNLSGLMLEFDYRSNSTSYAMTMVVGVATDISSLEGLDSTFVALDTITAAKWVAASANWYHYAKSFDTYQGEGQLVFYSPKFPSSSNAYAYIDNIYISKTPTCFRPIDVTFKSATATSLTFSWTPQGDETQWDVMVVEKDSAMSESFITVDTITATIADLQNSKEYDFYVRANCGAGDVSEWSAVVSAQTLCRVNAEDAAWNFDDAATQVQSSLSTSTTYKEEQCWLYGNKMSTSYTYAPYIIKNSYSSEVISTRYAYSDSCAYRFYSTATYNGAYVVIPELMADLDTMQISFKGRSVYESYSTAAATRGQFTKYVNTYATDEGTTKYARGIKVGTVTDPYDMSTFEELADWQFQKVANANCSTKVEGDYWEDVTVSLYQAKGKFIAFLSEYNANNYAWIDNIKVEKENGLNMPTKLKVDEDLLSGYSIPVTWTSRAPKIQVVLKNDQDSIIACDTITDAAYTFTGLTPTATYKVEISAMNAEETEVSNAAKLSVTTPCVAYTKDEAKWDFKNPTNAYTGSASYLLPTCWDGGILVGTSATYNPQAILNTSNYQYSRESYNKDLAVQDRALRFYNGTTTGSGYVIFPELNIDEDSTALHFWMRAAYFYTSTVSTSTNRNKLYTANNNYAKELVVGAIADETDMSTFVAIDTITYPYSWSSATNVYTTDDKNDYWYEVVLPLKKYKDLGKLVMLYPTNSKAGYMFVDDVEVIDADFCTSVTSLQVKDIQSNKAAITWQYVGTDSVQLQVATEDEFEESSLIVDTILANSNGMFALNDLQPGSDYYARVMHICSEEESSDWAFSGKFSTLYDVRFTEKFTEARTYPKNWMRASITMEEVLDEGKTPQPLTSETAVSWTRQAEEGDIAVTTGSGTGASSSTTLYHYWLITPGIDLVKQPAEDSLMLSFDIRLTNDDNQLPFNTPAEDDEFIVAVSADGGTTFLRENATIWALNAGGDTLNYAEIGGIAKTFKLDMSKYIGNNIKIAFVENSLTASGKPASKNYLHIDNVQLNTYSKNAYEASICQWEDYNDGIFQLDADELIPGATTLYEQFKQNSGTEKDQLTQLSLTVTAEAKTELQATICYGEDYSEHGFNIMAATQSAVYKQKLTSAASCDSIVELALTVLPQVTSRVEKTICQGDFYEFNGVKYYTNTIHTDTLVSMVTGCDSLATLYLTVNAILVGSADEHLCPGDSVEFGKYGKIGTAGTYVDTIKNALGCDSVATLNVFTHNTEYSITRAVILQGDSYNKYPWIGLRQAGDYPITLETIWGCDSIATLHLMVAGASLLVEDTITVNELPYIINDILVLPVNTRPGVYNKNLTIEDETVRVRIHVDNATALEDIYGDDNDGVIKVIDNNQLIIIRNGKRYNAVGAKLR